jgi:uncharacterized protein Veg
MIPRSNASCGHNTTVPLHEWGGSRDCLIAVIKRKVKAHLAVHVDIQARQGGRRAFVHRRLARVSLRARPLLFSIACFNDNMGTPLKLSA